MSHENEEVGYKKPPISTRWVKGKSGNPRGRRRAVTAPSVGEDIVAIFGKPVRGLRNGKPVKADGAKVMFRNLCRRALRGEKRAMAEVIDVMINLVPDPGLRKITSAEAAAASAKILKRLPHFIAEQAQLEAEGRKLEPGVIGVLRAAGVKPPGEPNA